MRTIKKESVGKAEEYWPIEGEWRETEGKGHRKSTERGGERERKWESEREANEESEIEIEMGLHASDTLMDHQKQLAQYCAENIFYVYTLSMGK